MNMLITEKQSDTFFSELMELEFQELFVNGEQVIGVDAPQLKGKYEGLKALKSHERCTNLSHLDCVVSNAGSIRSVCRILHNSRRAIETLEVNFEYNLWRAAWETKEWTFDSNKIEKFIDDSSTFRGTCEIRPGEWNENAIYISKLLKSISLRVLKISEFNNRFLKLFVVPLLETNSIIEEISFRQFTGAISGFNLELPTVVEAISRNPNSTIKQIISEFPIEDAIPFYPVRDGKSKVEGVQSRQIIADYHIYVGKLIQKVSVWWDSGDFTVDRVVLDHAPAKLWKKFASKGSIVNSGENLEMIDGEYCMTCTKK
ncbi:hypothetical protein HK098_004053 [Nowakowskiella sp. JEL0407]|nr:hypothetical protein HK098_004053 [Nowakowskiella sp. JEL0407]